MDPWLEHPALWPDVHRNLISVFQELLTPQVAPELYVGGEERMYIAGASSHIEPDVLIAVRERQPTLAGASQATLASRPPIIFRLTTLEDEVRERFLEIRERGTHRVVTVIELLSPANKLKGAPRYEQFVRKRAEVLNSDAHWIEIDLLRAGTRWELVPGQSDYGVMLSRVERRHEQPPTGEAWLFSLRDRLPMISVPLRPPHADAALDLQVALNLVYDRAGYGLSIDYTRPADPPLPASDAAWAQAHTRYPHKSQVIAKPDIRPINARRAA
jgi:hypothetical protein